MVRSIIVADLEEIEKLASGLPRIAGGLDGAESKYVPVFSTGTHQLVIFRNGEPFMGYRVTNEERQPQINQGMRAIERFFESFDSKSHLVMLYDNPELARSVEFQYMKLGFEKGEMCMYVIPEDDDATPESVSILMEKAGIDAQKYLKNGRLKFVKISDPAKDPNGFKAGCEKILQSLITQATSRVRMVLHVRYLFNTKDEIESHAEFENIIQSSFSDFPGSMFCNHYVGKNTAEKHKQWTTRMLETHDHVFMVTSSKTSGALIF
jgi:MEDS: MEthanogen/methylotroph, DcmR Sensory domain